MSRRLVTMDPDKLAFAKCSAFAEPRCNNTWLYHGDDELRFERFFNNLLGFVHTVKQFNPKCLAALLIWIRGKDYETCIRKYQKHLLNIRKSPKKRRRGGSIWNSSN